jgi:DNA-binding MarR family transcriptional regulator
MWEMDDASARKLVELTADLMRIVGRMKRAAEPEPRNAVHPGTQFAILDTILRHECRTVPEIASSRGVARQSVQTVINRLIDGKILYYEDNPDHKSSRLLCVTPEGQAMYHSDQLDMVRRYKRVKGQLQDGDLAAASRVLNVIAATWSLPERSRKSGGEVNNEQPSNAL